MGIDIMLKKIYTSSRRELDQVRNPRCIWNSYKGCTSVPAVAMEASSFTYNIDFESYGGVALTKRHILHVQHWGGNDAERPFGGDHGEYGGKFKFVGPNNENYWAKVHNNVTGKQVGTTDLRIVMLQEDLPDWVEIGQIASPEIYEYLNRRYQLNRADKVPMVGHTANGDRQIRVCDGRCYGSGWTQPAPTELEKIDYRRLDYYRAMTGGDSATVQHILVDNELIVIGNTTTPGSGATLYKRIDEINDIIDELCFENRAASAGHYRLQITNKTVDDVKRQFLVNFDYITDPEQYPTPTATPVPTVTPNPTPTPTATPVPTDTPVPTPTPTATPVPTPTTTLITPTPYPSVTPTPTPTPEPTKPGKRKGWWDKFKAWLRKVF